MCNRCPAIDDRGYQCLLVRHLPDTPHFSVGARYWGGRCARCGKPAEQAHEACEPKEKARGE